MTEYRYKIQSVFLLKMGLLEENTIFTLIILASSIRCVLTAVGQQPHFHFIAMGST
jgi:hypothetical protein